MMTKPCQQILMLIGKDLNGKITKAANYVISNFHLGFQSITAGYEADEFVRNDQYRKGVCA
jgi:hypothetical protein